MRINILNVLGGEGGLTLGGKGNPRMSPPRYFRIFFKVPGLYRQLLQNSWNKIILIVYYITCNFSERSEATNIRKTH